jgi:hypothetical protein
MTMKESDAPNQKLGARRPTLEEQKFAFDTQIQNERLEIEKSRNAREARFFRANLGIVITALVSIGAISASGWQFYFSQVQEQRKQAAELQARIDDQRLKVLEYLSTHRTEFFFRRPQGPTAVSDNPALRIAEQLLVRCIGAVASVYCPRTAERGTQTRQLSVGPSWGRRLSGT